jgi:hypothetical protein
LAIFLLGQEICTCWEEGDLDKMEHLVRNYEKHTPLSPWKLEVLTELHEKLSNHDEEEDKHDLM